MAESSADPVVTHPFDLFTTWFQEAQRSEIGLAEAAALATCDEHGHPTVRMVLIKEPQAAGFQIFTNLKSPKAHHLKSQPVAELCFHWKSLHRQVRVSGVTSLLSDQQNDAYFATRPRESQLGAWASNQSESIDNREQLDDRYQSLAQEYQGHEVPRPPHWGGFLLVPDRYEFWREQPGRMHDRFAYSAQSQGEWVHTRLQP